MDSLQLLDKGMSWNACPEMLNGKPAVSFGVGWENYLNSGNKFTKIDCNMTQTLSGFEMTKAPFSFLAPPRSNKTVLMVNDNQFDLFPNADGVAKTLITAPEFSQQMKCLGVEDVAGQIVDLDGNGRQDTVLYPEAYRSGFVADLIYRTYHGITTRLEKLVRFNSAPAPSAYSLVDGERVLPIQSEIQYSGKAEITPTILLDREKPRIEQLWNESGQLFHDKGFYIRAGDEPQKRGIGIKKVTIWDSNPVLQKKWTIQAYLEKKAGYVNTYIFTKLIPESFFTGAVLPVFTDATFEGNPDAGTGSTTVDGWVAAAGLTDTFHNIVVHAGNSFDATVASGPGVRLRSRSTLDVWRQINRYGATIDTSSIPAEANIPSATWSIYGTLKLDGLSATPDINLYSFSPASDNALIGTDYSTLGGVAFSTPITYAGFNETGFNNFILNPTAIATIGKGPGGRARLGNRNANYDAADSAPGWVSNVNSWLFWNFADNPTNKPKLVIEYTLPGVGNPYYYYRNTENQIRG